MPIASITNDNEFSSTPTLYRDYVIILRETQSLLHASDIDPQAHGLVTLKEIKVSRIISWIVIPSLEQYKKVEIMLEIPELSKLSKRIDEMLEYFCLSESGFEHIVKAQ